MRAGAANRSTREEGVGGLGHGGPNQGEKSLLMRRNLFAAVFTKKNESDARGIF